MIGSLDCNISWISLLHNCDPKEYWIMRKLYQIKQISLFRTFREFCWTNVWRTYFILQVRYVLKNIRTAFRINILTYLLLIVVDKYNIWAYRRYCIWICNYKINGNRSVIQIFDGSWLCLSCHTKIVEFVFKMIFRTYNIFPTIIDLTIIISQTILNYIITLKRLQHNLIFLHTICIIKYVNNTNMQMVVSE